MSRKFILLYIFLLICQGLSAMKPGPNLIVECPDCGSEKELMTIVSGNTIGALLWSDGFQYAPMLPSLSPVQKCLECNSYFMLDSTNPRYSENTSDFSLETGRLSYKEIKEALIQLLKSDLSKEDEIQLRLEYLHRFNDTFRDSENVNLPIEFLSDTEREEVDFTLFNINLNKLIDLIGNDPYFRLLLAELYREKGDFNESLLILKDYQPIDERESIIKELIRHNAENFNKEVILIER